MRDDVVSIFILPPSIAELDRRLRGRGQDSDEVIAGAHGEKPGRDQPLGGI
jgi:guanylate kinase